MDMYLPCTNATYRPDISVHIHSPPYTRTTSSFTRAERGNSLHHHYGITDIHSTPRSILLIQLMSSIFSSFFFFNDTATTEIYTLSLHDALPICQRWSTWLS